MTRIVAYAYGADVHSPEATRLDWQLGRLTLPENATDAVDENGIPLGLRDGEGNVVRPVFSTDEGADENARLAEANDARNIEQLFSRALEEADANMINLLIETYGERIIAQLINDWSDGSWTHPNDGVCEGFAWVAFGWNGEALVTEWDNYGFEHIYFSTVEDCEAEAAAREAEAEEEE